MDLSIVTTLYYSAPYLAEFYRRMTTTAREITDSYEIILVNDGSPDDALEKAVALFERDKRVRVIDLSRNFGHHRAMMTGLAYAHGEEVFLIDCDLEEDPELLVQFYRELTHTKADVVYGVQKVRKDGLLSRLMASLFYYVFDMLSDHPVPHHLMTIRLMNRKYVENLIKHRDKEIFMAGLWEITGFHQVPLAVEKTSKGSSTYSLRKRVSIFVNAVTSFSSKPLAAIFYLGVCIMIASGIAALYLIIRRIFFGVLLAGWPSLIVSIWLLGGMTIFCLGIIGIYLSKVFTETKDRPYTVIRKIYERGRENESKPY